MSESQSRPANALIHESSPYLLQHAYNPVNWVAYSEAVFETARQQNKPLIISIGYSACHWCHVMERECFEDEQVAKLMNDHFICVKVDREERPDVDMMFMSAVQIMTGQGGWPLNCFVLPDGRPFYGGTYFPKAQFIQILDGLNRLYTEKPEKVNEYASELTLGMRNAELASIGGSAEGAVSRQVLHDSVKRWKGALDNENGGPNRAPKFPLPNNYVFMLRYAVLENDNALLEHVCLTLDKMAMGGINDQVRGGFARYSTDMHWKVPHFEKMLYDNAQLVSLYTEAFLVTKNKYYRETALRTIDFVVKEWYREGCFFSALDADSEGEEGKYYVWTKEELQQVLDTDFEFFAQHFEINHLGYWEDGNYILMRSDHKDDTYDDEQPRVNDVRLKECLERLEKAAESRVKPGLDDKVITSWNAMMCSACAQAWLAFGRETDRDVALASARFLMEQMNRDQQLFRIYKNGKVSVKGVLEDYAFVVRALMDCYLVSADESYLLQARRMTEQAIGKFGHEDEVYFYYSEEPAANGLHRQLELNDNVIPASNSVMALNLFLLASYFDLPEWRERATKMLQSRTDDIRSYGSGYSNWGCLALYMAYPFIQVCIVGKDVDEKLRILSRQGLVNTIFAVGDTDSQIPLLKDKVNTPGLIYVCRDFTCGLPVSTTEEAIAQLA